MKIYLIKLKKNLLAGTCKGLHAFEKDDKHNLDICLTEWKEIYPNAEIITATINKKVMN